MRGEKGTAKSTIVRALAALLPAGRRRRRLPVRLRPGRAGPGLPGRAARSGRPGRRVARRALVELPVGASEDRVVGSLDIERALTEGVKAYEPGLLAAAHRGVLYVDEVNLLHDHLVDLLLDAAAMGTCLRRARGGVGPARGAVPARRDDEPRGGRAAPAAARPVRADGRGGRRRADPGSGPRWCGAGWRTRPTRRRSPARWADAEAGLAARIAAARQRLPQVRAARRASCEQIAAVCAGVRGRRAARRPRHRPRRHRARRLARPRRGDRGRRPRRRPGWRCRTAAAATRSTPPAWTSERSTSCWTSTSPDGPDDPTARTTTPARRPTARRSAAGRRGRSSGAVRTAGADRDGTGRPAGPPRPATARRGPRRRSRDTRRRRDRRRSGRDGRGRRRRRHRAPLLDGPGIGAGRRGPAVAGAHGARPGRRSRAAPRGGSATCT